MNGRPWTSSERALLEAMVRAERYTQPEIAMRLGRSYAAVQKKIVKWRLSVPGGQGRPRWLRLREQVAA